LVTVPQNPAQFVFVQTHLVPTKFIYGNIFDANGSISCAGITINFIGNQLDVGDSKLIVHAVTGLTCFSFSTPQKFVADVDGDRKITVNDASLILKKLNGLIQCFPVECQN
ncbi:hypothetical protein IT568_11930, partial [bacterium]|nr:hypothetical protein [bacterium]